MRCGQSWLIEKHRFVGFDEDGGFPANIAVSEAERLAERAKPSGAIEYRASEASGAIRY